MSDCPLRLPNGLVLRDGTGTDADPSPQYRREIADVKPSPAALRVQRDVLSDVNSGAVRIWRLAAQFDAVAADIGNAPRCAASAIVDGMVNHCAFNALQDALRSDRDPKETRLLESDIDALCDKIEGFSEEVHDHVARVLAPPEEGAVPLDESANTAPGGPLLLTAKVPVTPAEIASAAATIHESISALIFSPTENAKYAPDSPRRNRGKALIARLHQAQAAFEKATPSSTTPAPTPYAERTLGAFREAVSRLTSLTVPSTVDTIAAEAVVRWTQAAVARLETGASDAAALGGAWRRLSLVWLAELKTAPTDTEGNKAAEGKPSALRLACDPFRVRAAFGVLADEAAAAIPQRFDFSCDDARRSASVLLPEIAGSAPLKNDATLRCLEGAAEVLTRVRDRVAGLWAHVAQSAPRLVLAARDVAIAMGAASEAVEVVRRLVVDAKALAADPGDKDHRGLAVAVLDASRHATLAMNGAPNVAVQGTEPVDDTTPAERLTEAANDLSEFAAIAMGGGADAAATTGMVRPSIARLEAFVEEYTTQVTHRIDSLRTAIISQCVLPEVNRRLAPAAAAHLAAVNVGAAPYVFARQIVERLAALNEAGARPPPADDTVGQSWVALARAWSRACAVYPIVEKRVERTPGQRGCTMRVAVTSGVIAKPTVAPQDVLDLCYRPTAEEEENGVGQVPLPAVRDALTFALAEAVERYNGPPPAQTTETNEDVEAEGVAEGTKEAPKTTTRGWVVMDYRVADAAELDRAWKFILFAVAMRRLAFTAGVLPANPITSSGVEDIEIPTWAHLAPRGTGAAAARAHPLIDALDRCIESVGVLGVDAANLTDTSEAGISRDLNVFSPNVAARVMELSVLANTATPDESAWWNDEADVDITPALPEKKRSVAATEDHVVAPAADVPQKDAAPEAPEATPPCETSAQG